MAPRSPCLLPCVLLLALLAAAKKHDSMTKRQPAVGCGDGNVRCSNGQCIPIEWLCDTVSDCWNSEDEVGCPTDCSGQHQVKCANSRCVPLAYRCDGNDDCGDGTDEQECDKATWECRTTKEKCPGSVCIESLWLCDGDRDCPDGWDELPANCPATTTEGG